MSRYLSALKESGNLAGQSLKNLNNPASSGSLGSLGAPLTSFEFNQAANDNDEEAATRDQITVARPSCINDDDRRFCRQCARLRGTICTIAQPGGVVSAKRGYTPTLDLPHRCEAFMERNI